MNKATPIAQLPRHTGAPPRSGEIPEVVDDDDVAIQEVLAEINQAQDSTVTNAQMQQVYAPPPVTLQPPKVAVHPPPVPPQPGTQYAYPLQQPVQQPYPQPPYYVPPQQAPVGLSSPPPGLMDSVAKHLWEVCKNDLILFGIVFAVMFLVNTEQIESGLKVYLANTRFQYAVLVVKALLAATVVIMLKRFMEA